MIRRAIRSLVATPGVSAVVVLTLALGVGASAAILNVFSVLVWQPIQLPDAARLVHVWTNYPARNLQTENISVQKYRLFERGQQSFISIAAASASNSVLTGGDATPLQLNAMWVTASYVPTLGLRVGAGRNFESGEDIEHGAAVCILSRELWQTRFGARADIVGQTAEIDGAPVTIVGVLAENMPLPLAGVQVLRPWPFSPASLTRQQIEGGAGFLTVTGRLRPGKSLADATADLHALFLRYADANPGRLDAKGDNYVRAWSEEFTGPMLRPVQLLIVAVVLVIALAAANVSHVLLARWMARRTECAVRLALGATRTQVAVPLIAEAGVLCGLTAAASTLVALLLNRLAERQLASQLQITVSLPLSASHLVWIFCVCLAVTIAVCVAPLLQAVLVSASDGLGRVRGVGGGAGARRFRDALVAGEAMLAVVLLVGAGALLASLRSLEAVPPGFTSRGVASVELDATAVPFADQAAKVEFYERVIDEVKKDSRVTAASLAQGLPFSNSIGRFVYAVHGRPVPPLAERPVAYGNIVSEEYFRGLQIPVREGRTFSDTDRAGTKAVCVINESLARRLFPGESAVGRTILRGQQADQPFEIVGVVGDVKSLGLGAPVPDTMYVPLRQSTADVPLLTATMAGDEAPTEALFRSAVSRVSRIAAISSFLTIAGRTEQSLSVERVTSSVTAAFAVVALALAALGIYGVVNYTAIQRTSELGLRAALGATRRQLAGLLLGEALRRVSIGVVLGVVLAGAGGSLLKSLLFGVGAFDLRIVAASASLLLLSAVVACLWPSLRASRADPAEVMRAS